ncbi:helix-turn-helix domain-containing protein [Nocardia wallacei]|uniref:helix-turn-helix domain-containing protein n=1 Tax=Nocardia wallacei TaxID=480035 RepID=UPI002455F1C5|nr:helix-turn-helix domain-containing protein [Nocardia wallacei]
MTPAEIRATREHLGLSHAELAAVLAIDERSVRRWETGAQAIHADNARAVRRLADLTTNTVNRHVIDLRGRPNPVLVTYRCDEDMWQHHPKYAPFPAKWHRVIAARVAELVPDLTITYYTETP